MHYACQVALSAKSQSGHYYLQAERIIYKVQNKVLCILYGDTRGNRK